MSTKNDQEVFGADSRMAQLLAKTNFVPKVFSKGEVVEGVILSKLKDIVLVDIGAKAEGILSIKDIEETGQKGEVGENISALVAQPEGDSGTIVLTNKKAPRDKL